MVATNFLDSLQGAFKLPDLRARIMFVFAMFAVYAVGLHIPVPGVDREQMARIFSDNELLGLLNMFTGGALRKFTILALGLNPYITSSIIMQVFTFVHPPLRQLQREGGEAGRRKIQQYTRWFAVIIAFVQAIGFISFFRSAGGLTTLGMFETATVVIALVSGAMFLLWLGEQITEKGIGNGVSLMIFAGIVAMLPFQVSETIRFMEGGAIKLYQVLFLLAIFLATIWGIVYVTQSQRRIPIQHVRRIIGRRQTMGGTSYLPIPVNAAGVIPIIFALSLQVMPATLASMIPKSWGVIHDSMMWVANTLAPGQSIIGSVFFAGLIFIFTYVYIAMAFNTEDISDNLKRQGSFIQGVRPGKPTADYLDAVITRITVAGASFLALIAMMQYWVPSLTGVTTFGLAGGTSLLIMVGVGLDFIRQIEAQMSMRQYEDFLK